MPQHEGFVASIKPDGRAEVIIQPSRPCISGAPQISNMVCHCATDSSTITTEALNTAGADVGDWVSISQESAALMKNAAALLGIPMAGLMGGTAVASVLTHGFSLHIPFGVLVAAAGLLLGTVMGVVTFKRISTINQPVIERIIKTRLEAAFLHDDNQSPFRNGDRGCDGCAGPIP